MLVTCTFSINSFPKSTLKLHFQASTGCLIKAYINIFFARYLAVTPNDSQFW